MLACHEQGDKTRRMAPQPAEMNNRAAVERRPGVPEPSITACPVCKSQIPRRIGPIIQGQGRGGA